MLATTLKYEVSGYMWDVLHWLPLPTVNCLPSLCVGLALHRGSSTSLSAGILFLTVAIQHRISLRSSAQVQLLVLRTRTVIRVFSVAGPTAWNGLPIALHLKPVGHSALFLSGLKTIYLTEVRLGAPLGRLPWRGTIYSTDYILQIINQLEKRLMCCKEQLANNKSCNNYRWNKNSWTNNKRCNNSSNSNSSCNNDSCIETTTTSTLP